MKFILQNLFKPIFCIRHPERLYVFGDNVKRFGKKGQAVIREQPNTFGIATKYAPNNKKNSFFSDKICEQEIIQHDFEKLNKIIKENKYEYIVFPKRGIGPGLAQLPQKAPLIYKQIQKNINAIKERLENDNQH